MKQTSRRHFNKRRVGVLMILGFALLLIISCGRSSDQDDAAEGGGIGMLSDRTELLDRRYTYLLRGDDGFPTITSGYRIKTNPADDGVSAIALVPDKDRPVDGDDSCLTFKVGLQKASEISVVVADSIGSGMVCFDFGELPPGDYTLFTGAFPPEMERWTKDCKRLVIFLTVGKSIRHRARWGVTEHGRLAHQLNF